MSGNIYPCGCPVAVPTIFVYDTIAAQTAANNVYEQKKAYDAAKVAAGKTEVYTFKSDWERMQYLLGRMGRQCNPPTTGS